MLFFFENLPPDRTWWYIEDSSKISSQYCVPNQDDPAYSKNCAPATCDLLKKFKNFEKKRP